MRYIQKFRNLVVFLETLFKCQFHADIKNPVREMM